MSKEGKNSDISIAKCFILKNMVLCSINGKKNLLAKWLPHGLEYSNDKIQGGYHTDDLPQ